MVRWGLGQKDELENIQWIIQRQITMMLGISLTFKTNFQSVFVLNVLVGFQVD